MGCETAGEAFAEREMDGCRKAGTWRAVLECIVLMENGVGRIDGSCVCELERRNRERMELEVVRFGAGLGENSAGVASFVVAVVSVGVSRTLEGGGVAGVFEMSGFMVWPEGSVAEERAE